MTDVSVTEQTRQQVERAQRACEEARERIRVGRSGGLRLSPDIETDELTPLDAARAATD
ncbi:MAG TPA: hypothetical protein VIJ94_13170 [Caulobacteraceae bacterium]